MKHFDVMSELAEFECPYCSGLCDLEHLIFSNCKFSFYYSVYDPNTSKYKTAKQDSTVVEDKEFEFPYTFSEIKASWDRFVLDVMDINDPEICQYCLAYMKDGEIVEIDGNKYHRKCSYDVLPKKQ